MNHKKRLTMSENSREGGRYGLSLDQYFSSGQHDLSRRTPPSRAEILRAIRSLPNPSSVSCETFEIILAMGRTPAAAHLDLLLSDIGVFRECFELLLLYAKTEGANVGTLVY